MTFKVQVKSLTFAMVNANIDCIDEISWSTLRN